MADKLPTYTSMALFAAAHTWDSANWPLGSRVSIKRSGVRVWTGKKWVPEHASR